MAWDVLTDEQREIRELVRTLARERVAPRAAAIDESHEFPWDIVELFREHELFGLLFDEEWGGSGTGTLLALVAIEEVSKVCATSGYRSVRFSITQRPRRALTTLDPSSRTS